MDELDALRAFRADAPEPSAEARATALATLHREMTRGESARSSHPRGIRFARVLAPVAVALVALLALALASPLFGSHTGESNAAARELQSLANVASAQPSTPTLAPGQFTYTRSDNVQLSTSFNVNGGSSSKLESFTREIWIGPDGSGRIHEVGTGVSPSNILDQQFGPGGLTPPLETDGFSEAELMRLAQHPDQLAQAIRQQAAGTKNPVNQESFVIVGDLLRESGAPAQLRAALFQVAAGIPGVELLGNVTDPAGRTGVSVAISANGIRSELIFDRQTSMLLAERQTIVTPVPDLHFPVGTVIGSMTYLSSGVVDSTTATP